MNHIWVCPEFGLPVDSGFVFVMHDRGERYFVARELLRALDHLRAEPSGDDRHFLVLRRDDSLRDQLAGQARPDRVPDQRNSAQKTKVLARNRFRSSAGGNYGKYVHRLDPMATGLYGRMLPDRPKATETAIIVAHPTGGKPRDLLIEW